MRPNLHGVNIFVFCTCDCGFGNCISGHFDSFVSIKKPNLFQVVCSKFFTEKKMTKFGSTMGNFQHIKI